MLRAPTELLAFSFEKKAQRHYVFFVLAHMAHRAAVRVKRLWDTWSDVSTRLFLKGWNYQHCQELYSEMFSWREKNKSLMIKVVKQENLHRNNYIVWIFCQCGVFFFFTGGAIYTVCLFLQRNHHCKSYKVFLSARFWSDVLDSFLTNHHQNTKWVNT